MNKKLLLVASFIYMSFATIMQAGSIPTMSRAYSDRFINEVSPSRQIADVGTLDNIFGTDGSFYLDNIGSNSQALAVKALPDGTFLVLMVDPSNTYVAKYTETGILESNYSCGTGYGVYGVTSLTDYQTSSISSSLIVDHNRKILVSGFGFDSDSRGWVQRILPSGFPDSSFNWTDGAEWSGNILVGGLQSSGKIIVVGFNNSTGAIARYKNDGCLDTHFGVSGRIALNGGVDRNSHTLPISTKGIYKAVIDAQDNIYISYFDVNNYVYVARFTSDGALDTSWGSSGVVNINYLVGATDQHNFIAMDANNNLIIAAQVGDNILVTSIHAADGSVNTGFTNFATSGATFQLQDLMTTTDGSCGHIYLIGSDLSTINMAVIRLTDHGLLDTSFNEPATSPSIPGDNLFSIASPDISSILYGASIAEDGKLYAIGSQVTTSGYEDGEVNLTINVNAQYIPAYTHSVSRTIIVPDSDSTATTHFNVALTGDNGDNSQIATVNVTATHSNANVAISSISFTGGLINNGSSVVVTSHFESGYNLHINYTVYVVASGAAQTYTGNYSEDVDFPYGTSSIPQSGIEIDVYSTNNPDQTATVALTVNSDGTTSINSISYSGTLTDNGSYITTNSYTTANYGTATTSYVSRLNNNVNTLQVAQYPTEKIQGDFDLSFGGSDVDSGDGIVRPFDGHYGALLQQQAEVVIELSSGKILVGMSGKLDTNNHSNMILARLHADGSLDNCFGTNGKLNLEKTYCDEYIVSMIEDENGNLLVVGCDETNRPFLRKYPTDGSTGVASWEVLWPAGYQAFGVAIQASQRIVMYGQIDATHGVIGTYTPSGDLDAGGFNANGYIPGVISPQDFGGSVLANMGPIHALVIDEQDNIYIAYKNTSFDAFIDVAKIYDDGHGLITEFGDDNTGVLEKIFGDHVPNSADIRIALDNEERLVVVGVSNDGTSYEISRLFAVEGTYDRSFGSDSYLEISNSCPAWTSLSISQLTILNDNTIIITGNDNATDDTMLSIRVTSCGALDCRFNSEGKVPGILPIKVGHIVRNYYARQATGLVIQSSEGNVGNMIIAGYEQQTASLSIPMVMRVYGDCGTTQIKQSPIEAPEVAGTLDQTFGSNIGVLGDGSLDLSTINESLIGAAKVVYAYRSGNQYEGKILVGVDTGSDTIIARIKQYDNCLDSCFGTDGLFTISGVTGVTHLSIDAQNKILVAGNQSGNGWAYRLTEDGMIDIVFTSLVGLVEINALYQQKSGRYIVAGKDSSSNGVFVAFQDQPENDNQLHVDTTFNPLGQVNGTAGLTTPGWYTVTAASDWHNVTINQDDTILVAYADTTVKVIKVTDNGSGLVTSFGTSGVVDTGITTSSASSVRCATDSNGKVIVAASVGSNSVSVVRYVANGSAIDSAFNGGAVYTIAANELGSTGVQLTDLIITNEQSPAVDDKIILLGYNTSGGNGRLFATRLGNDQTPDSSNGILDPTWNIDPSGLDIVGLTTFNVDSGASIKLYNGSIYINGDIYCAVGGTGNIALLVRIFGDDYVVEVEEQPFEVAAGIIDTTLDTVTPGSGALNFSQYYLDAALCGYTSQKIYIYSSGAMIFGFSNGTNSIVVKLKADESLDTSFNSSGTPGYATICSIKNLEDLFVADGTNNDASIYLVGNNGDGKMVAAKLDAAGVRQTFITPNTKNLTYGSTIRRSTNSRTLIAGFDGNSGVIVAYDNTDCSVDLSFANGVGAYYTGVNSIIPCMELDTNNRMYIAYYNDGNITVQRIEANGSQVDTTFNAASITPANFFTFNDIHLAIDEAHNQVVVAALDGACHNNIIQVYRYNLVDGSPAGSLSSQITIMCKTLHLTNVFIDDAYNIYVAGYNSTDHNVVVARINNVDSSTIALDANYAANGGTAGIANVAAGSMMTASYAALHPDRRVYVIGQSCHPTPYMARIFGDVYTTEDDQAILEAIPGTIDLTLDPNEEYQDGGIIISNIANWSGLSGYTARGVHANSDGSTYIILDNGSSWVLAKADCDMNDASFGTNGLTPTVWASSVNSLAVDSQNRILVAGISYSGDFQKVYRYMTDGNCYTEFSDDVALTSVSRIAEQKSGRVLVSGYQLYDSYHNCGGGTIIAYKHDGSALDFTYGPECKNGFYAINLDFPIDDMVVNSFDAAFIVYRDTTIKIQKITANGSGLDAIFNSGAIVDTGIVATQPAHIGINCAGNILVGASSGVTIKTAMYDGSTGARIGSVQDLCSQDMNTPILTGITGAGDEFVMSAYETTNSEINQMLTIRMTSAGIIDTTFNPNGVQGVAESDPKSAINMNGISVQPDGRIVMVGNNASHPVLMRVYGTPYVKEDAQYPDKVAAGILDRTLFPCHGDLNLDTLLESVDLSGYTARKIYIDACAKTLLALDNGTNTILVKLHKDLTLDYCFGSSGSVTISGVTDVRGLCVDSDNHIFVTGGTDSSWMRAFDCDGSPLCGFTLPTNNMYASYQIGLQSLDRIIIAGIVEDGAVLAGYKITTGEFDPEFGNVMPGAFGIEVSSPIADFAIDNLDRIYIVYNDGSNNSVLKRVNTNGSLVDTSFGTPTGFGSVTGDELKVLVDNSNSHVIVAAATVDGFEIQSYATSNGATVNGPVTIDAGGSSTSHIANIFVTSDDKIVLVGYETTCNKIVVARFNSDLSYDSAFNGGNVLMTHVGNMTTAFDTTMHPDDRIMIVGGNTAGNEPYMSRVFGDCYVTVDVQEPTLGITGTLDPTFNLGNPYTYLNTLGGTTGAAFDPQVGNDLVIDGNGKIVVTGITLGSPGSLFVARYNSDGTFDTTFNSGSINGGPGYVIDIYPGSIGNALVIDGDGNILVAGSIEGEGTALYVSRYTSAGVLDSTFATDTNAFPYGNTGAFMDINGSTGRAISLDSSNNIIVVGETYGYNLYVARYTSAGIFDTTFNSTGYVVDTNASQGYGVAIDSSNNVIVVGTDLGVAYTARYTTAGILDLTFNVEGEGLGYIYDTNGQEARGVVIDGSGNIVIAGQGASGKVYIARYTSVGVFDTTFNGTGHLLDTNGNGAYAVTINKNSSQPSSGNIFVTGIDLTSFASYTAEYTPAGVLASSLITPNGYFSDTNAWYGLSIKIDSTGRPFISGTTSNGEALYVTRYLTTGAIDTSFTLATPPTGGSEPSPFIGASATAVLPYSNGTQCVTLDNGSSASYLIRLTEDATSAPCLDTAFNTTGIATPLAPQGAFALFKDALNNLIVTGTDSSAGWIQRYTSAGIADTTFAGTGLVSGLSGKVTTALEQSMARVVVAGMLDSYGALRGFKPDGSVDNLFGVDGVYSTGVANPVYSVVADQYDRLILAYLNATTGTVELSRLTSNGEADITFGTNNSGTIETQSVAYFPANYNFSFHSNPGNINGYYISWSAPTSTINIDGVPTSVYLDGSTITVTANFRDPFNVVINGAATTGTDFGNVTVTGTPSIAYYGGALSNVNSDPSSVKTVLDSHGRIIVAAVSYDGTSIEVAAYDNGTALSGNGLAIDGYTAGTPVTGMADVVITSLVAMSDGKVLIGGYESGTDTMFIARINCDGTLDTCFNPTAGNLEFEFNGAATLGQNNAIAILEDGRISTVGFETVASAITPFIGRVYNKPYTSEIAEFLQAQPIGTNDYTFGLTDQNIFTFFATNPGYPCQHQVARSVGIQGTNRFIIALDGKDDSCSHASHIFINKFNMDGILDTTFNSTGQTELCLDYDSQYVKDMMVYVTPEGVNKAILVGYASNCALGVDNSLLISYNLDTASKDDCFGGFDEDPLGEAFADIQSHQVVGMQSSGRIITGGVNYDSTGAILGYTKRGKLDHSFGSDGYFFTNSTDGIYSHAIDTLDRVVFAYIDSCGRVLVARLLADGSALDTSFNSDGIVRTCIHNVASSEQIRVAIDNCGKVIVTAMASSGLLLSVERYHNDGTLDVSINTGDQIAYSFTDAAISKLIIDQDNKIIIVGSDTTAGDLANIYVFRILADMSGFDTTFNGGLGYLAYNDATLQNPVDAMLHPDGRIVVVGSESNPPV